MKVKLVTWNVRGLNGGSNREMVRKLLHQWRADISLLVETKIGSSQEKLL